MGNTISMREEQWQNAPLQDLTASPVLRFCGCGRVLETEDELSTGYCLKHIPATWPEVVNCPKQERKIGQADCRFQRRYTPDCGGIHCKDCSHNHECAASVAVKEALFGVVIVILIIALAWELYVVAL